jgi:adenosylhomocysteine nucleosidase
MLAGSGVEVVIGGGNVRVLRSRLDKITHCTGVISAGICGALSPSLKVGACVVADAVVVDGRRIDTNAAWRGRMISSLPGAAIGAIAGSDDVLIDGPSKRALHTATGAIAVDMESHVAAAFAGKHGLAFAALRVVSDHADTALPPAVLTAMKPDGNIAIDAVMRSLAVKPSQFPALIRTAWESEVAFRALFRCLDRLGAGLLGPDFR